MKQLLALATVILLAFSNWASAKDSLDCVHFRYLIENVRIVDGDTIEADAQLGFRLNAVSEKFRLLGIDTPEVKLGGAAKTTEEEKQYGLAIKELIAKYVENSEGKKSLCLVLGSDGRTKRDKYGRYLAVFYIGELNLNAWMLEQGYANDDKDAPLLFSEEKRRILFDENGFNIENVSQ